jgi:HK97 gp10 family phage protein
VINLAGLKVEFVGADEATKTFNRIDEETAYKIQKQIVKSGLIIETNAKKAAPSDTGRLRSSIQTEIKDNGFTAQVFSDVNYAPHVEYGTKAHFPPPSALQGWARRHNMTGMEFLIARSISRRGTKARPFLFPAFENEKQPFTNSIKDILKGMR